MQEFRYEHVFRAASPAAVIAAYFDPDHLATQDEVAELADRTVIDSADTGTELRMVWRVTSKQALPVFVRPFIEGGRLRYVETMTWRRAADAIDLVIVPEVPGNRVRIAAEYLLSQAGPGQVLRRYTGTITAQVPLIAAKLERAIADKVAESMPAMTACTQGWLDRQAA